MSYEFICEPIEPVAETLDTAGMARGEPGLPRRFVWRERTYDLAEVLERWKETGPCRHGSGERYVRRFCFRFRTETGEEMNAFFERRARSGRRGPGRWWLRSAKGGAGDDC